MLPILLFIAAGLQILDLLLDRKKPFELFKPIKLNKLAKQINFIVRCLMIIGLAYYGIKSITDQNKKDRILATHGNFGNQKDA